MICEPLNMNTAKINSLLGDISHRHRKHLDQLMIVIIVSYKSYQRKSAYHMKKQILFQVIISLKQNRRTDASRKSNKSKTNHSTYLNIIFQIEMSSIWKDREICYYKSSL